MHVVHTYYSWNVGHICSSFVAFPSFNVTYAYTSDAAPFGLIIKWKTQSKRLLKSILLDFRALA